MKTTSQKMVVHLPNHAPIAVDYFFSDAADNSVLLDLHLSFNHSTKGHTIRLVEAIQRSASRADDIMQVIISDIVREHHLR